MGSTDDQMESYLAHYGILGMKWGVRRTDAQLGRANGGVSRKTRRNATKDAKEFTAAKMYYGDGAGTRRKLIKAKVEQRSKTDPEYKKLFDEAVANTDMSKRASQAQSKRKRTDVANSTKKTARGIGHILRGNAQYASLFAAGVMTVGTLAYRNGGDAYVKDFAQKGRKIWKDANAARRGKAFLKKNGF